MGNSLNINTSESGKAAMVLIKYFLFKPIFILRSDLIFLFIIEKFQVVSICTLLSVTLAAPKGPGGYSYNRFSGPVSGQIREIQVPAAEGLAAQQHADYGYNHHTGQIDPDTQKYAHLKTVDYVVSFLL